MVTQWFLFPISTVAPGITTVIKCTNVSVKLKLQQHQWQKEGRNTFSCQTKSLWIQQIIRIQYSKNWETLLAYLLRTKLSCNAAEITATRSLNAQLFFVCHATYKAFYKKIPPTEITTSTFHTRGIHTIFMTISLTFIITHMKSRLRFKFPTPYTWGSNSPPPGRLW